MPNAPAQAEICPLCGLVLSDPLSADHVFGKAFGASHTVQTHKACNNEFGGGAETVLHGATSFLNFARAAHGLAKLPIHGTTAAGEAVAVDLSTGETWSLKPEVTVRQEGEQVHLRVAGSEKQIRQILDDWRRKWGSVIPTVEQLPPEAVQRVARPGLVTLLLQLDLAAAEQFAVKAALGAGTLAYGPTFASSELAVALRDWAAQPFDNPMLSEVTPRPRMQLQILDSVSGSQQQTARAMGLAPDALPNLASAIGSAVRQAIFIPSPGPPPSTVVFVHVLGMPVMPWGLVVPAPLPQSEPWGDAVAPVLVREHADARLEVLHYTELLMRPVLVAAVEAEAALYSEDE